MPQDSVGLCECGCGEPTKLATKNHTKKGYVVGQPYRFVRGHQLRKSFDRWIPEDRGYETPCWIWQGFTNDKGYGMGIQRPGLKQGLAHRQAWSFANGPIPNGLHVLHHCDVPACVNPAHLFVGTQADNVADMVAKGRSRHPRGEQQGGSKLTEADVRAIRVAPASVGLGQLARRYRVGTSTIHDARTGKTWMHVA